MHLPGFGPKRARRLYDELGVDSLDALRAAAEDGADPRAARLRREGRGEPSCVLAEHERATARRRASCSRVRSRSPSRSSARCARTPRPTASRSPARCGGWADSVKDLDIIATADDPPALATALAELAAGRVGAREPGDAGARVITHSGMKVDLQGRRARPVRQRAPALHRLQGAQRGAARVGRAARAARLRVRDPRRRDRRDDCAARPRRRSTRRSGSPGSRRSCARAAASSRRRCRAAPGCRS